MVADFQKKEKGKFFNEQLLFRTIGIASLIFVVIMISTDFKIYQKKKELAAEISAYRKQIEDIKKSSQTLKDEIANQNNPDYLQKIAYEQLGEAKPGETVYSFISPPAKPEPVKTKTQNFWELLLGRLSGGFDWLKSKF